MPTFNVYGLIIGVAIWAGWLLAEKVQSRLKQRDPGYGSFSLDTLGIWMLGFGVVGARLYHVIDYWDLYSQNLWRIVAIWQGGIGVYGAFIGGIVGVLIYPNRS